MTELFKGVYPYFEGFFLIYLIIYSTFLLVSVTVGAVTLYDQKRRETLYNYIDHDYYIPISVIVPAHNESLTVADTVRSLLMVDYRLYEIIVVDDGSTDNTCERLIEQFQMERLERPIRKKIPCKSETEIYCTHRYRVPITLIRKENGGKADALNMGINASEFPYFICMDADSMLQHDALINIARPVLEQKDVVACGGLVRIANDIVVENGRVVDYRLPRSLLLCMQVLEYDRTFLASRLFFDKFNGNLIISGAFGLFRKDIVIGVGGYNNETMGEDMELVVRIHAFCRANMIPYNIKYSASAICWSQAPGNLSDLKKQRRRWHIGLYQSISAHRHLLFKLRYGLLSFISFMYFLIYELLSPYIEVVGVATMLLAWAFNLINVPYMLMFFGIYVVFGGILSLTAFFSRIHAMRFRLSAADICKAIGLCFIENVGLRLILAVTRLTALIGYKHKKLDWGRIQRQEHTKMHWSRTDAAKETTNEEVTADIGMSDNDSANHF